MEILAKGSTTGRAGLDRVTHSIEYGEWGNDSVNEVNASETAISVRYGEERHQGSAHDAANVSRISDNGRKERTRE